MKIGVGGIRYPASNSKPRGAEKLATWKKGVHIDRMLLIRNVVRAVYRPKKGLFEVTQARGKRLQSLGLAMDGRVYLTPPEAVYMMELSALEARYNGRTLSMQQAYAILGLRGVRFADFAAYTYLKKQDYVVHTFPFIGKRAVPSSAPEGAPALYGGAQLPSASAEDVEAFPKYMDLFGVGARVRSEVIGGREALEGLAVDADGASPAARRRLEALDAARRRFYDTCPLRFDVWRHSKKAAAFKLSDPPKPLFRLIVVDYQDAPPPPEVLAILQYVSGEVPVETAVFDSGTLTFSAFVRAQTNLTSAFEVHQI